MDRWSTAAWCPLCGERPAPIGDELCVACRAQVDVELELLELSL